MSAVKELSPKAVDRMTRVDQQRDAAPFGGYKKPASATTIPLHIYRSSSMSRTAADYMAQALAQHKFGMFMLKAVLDGRGGELIDLAKVNLTR